MKFKQRLLASAILVMRVTLVQFVFCIGFVFSLYAKETKAQNLLEKRITLNVKNESLATVINLVKKQTNVEFSFTPNLIDANRTVSYSLKNKKMLEFLNELARYNVGYRIMGDQVVLFRAKKAMASTESVIDLTLTEETKLQLVDIDVSGYVYDDTNLPLPGVSVTIKGATQGTSTNEKGFFRIRVKDENAVLVFKMVGLETREVRVGSQTTLRVSLKSAMSNLDDVVIVGYGTQKKINATGAISSISTKELVQSPVANISNSLVGRLPGLFASQAGGEPGNDVSTLRIRGSGTYSGNTNPLILVDGVEVPNYNNIDPNEIENLTILKDASSTAVYGIRGANGVLIITTKRGKLGTPRLSYTFNQGINSFTSLRNTMNSADFARSSNTGQMLDAYVTGASFTPRYSEESIRLYESGEDPIFHPNVNWFDEMFRKNSLQSQHNVTIGGGQKAVKYFISAGMFNQEGLFKDTRDVVDEFSAQSTYKRYNFRSNFNFDVTSRFKIALDLSSQFENRRSNYIGDPNSGFDTRRLVGDIARASPLDGPGVVDGKIVNITTNTVNNPYISLLTSQAGGGLQRKYDNFLNGALRLDHDLDFITKGFKIHSNFAFNTFNNQTLVNQITLPIYIVSRMPDGSLNFQPSAPTATPEFRFSQPAGAPNTSTRRITRELGLNYSRTFALDHAVTGLLLYNDQSTSDPQLATRVPKGYQSLVARATYAFKSKYFAEVNAGYNGSENFAPGRRYGLFPAFSAGWIPSSENFFPKNDIISFLKFRGSYGEVGNDNIGGNRFLYNSTSYTPRANVYNWGNYVGNYTPYAGMVEGAAGNAFVTWERAKKTDIGVEMYLLKEKVRISADYFSENRANILTTPNTFSQTAGIIQPAVNLGRMSNRGADGEISFTDRVGDFNYRIGANYSFARNKVLFRDEISNVYSYQNRTGLRMGQYFAIPVTGLFNTWEEANDVSRPVYQGNNRVQPGDFKYVDVNGDGIIDQFDQVPVGYSNVPEKTYGITLSGSFKGFDFSALFQGVGNVSINYTSFQRGTNFSAVPPMGAADYMIESWSPERYEQGLPIRFPRFTYAANNNPNNLGASIFIDDASYVRLKNVEIGYTIAPSLLKKVGVRTARVFANANNLYTWSSVLPGIDPENLPQSDTNNESYPLTRTINFGVNVNF